LKKSSLGPAQISNYRPTGIYPVVCI